MTEATLDAGVALPGTTRRKGRLGRFVKRLALLLLICAAVAAAARYGYDWWLNGRFVETTDDAYVGGNATAISPHVAGFVAEVAIVDNQHVTAGQVLVRLDDRDFRAAEARATAILGARKAKLTSLEAQAGLQDSMIRQAGAELDAKAAQAAFAHSDSGRYSNAANSAAITRQETDRSLSLDRQAKAAVLAAQAGVDAARQQLAVLNAQVAEAKAEVAQAIADLDTARLNLGYTTIRSPIDGYVGNRAAREGAYVSVGTYLVTIIPSSGLWVDANFKEDQVAHIVPGAAVTVVADVMPDRVLHGHVTSLSPGTGALFSVIPPENATGNFTKIVQRVPVRITLDAADGALGRLRPGLSTTVGIDTRTGGTAP